MLEQSCSMISSEHLGHSALLRKRLSQKIFTAGKALATCLADLSGDLVTTHVFGSLNHQEVYEQPLMQRSRNQHLHRQLCIGEISDVWQRYTYQTNDP